MLSSKEIIKHPLFYIVLLNFVIKLGMFLYISPWQKEVETTKIVISDSQGYEGVAENLTHYNSYAPQERNVDINGFSEFRATCFLCTYPDILWMPGYPTFLALIYKFTGIKPFIGIFIQILFSLFSVIMVYRLANLFFQKKNVSVLASLLYSIDIHSAYLANQLLPDTIFVTIFLLAVFWFFKGVINNKILFIALSAFLMGVDCLIKPIAMLYPAILMFFFFFFYKRLWTWKFKSALLFGVIYLSVIGTWAYRNHKLFNHWSLSVQAGDSFVMYNVAMTEQKVSHRNLDSIRVELQKSADSAGFKATENPFDKDAIYKKLTYDFILKHKWLYLKTHLQGAMNVFLSLGNIGMANTFGWTNNNPAKEIATVSMHRIILNFSANKKQALLGLLILLIMATQYVGALYGGIQLIRYRNLIFILLSILTMIYWAGLIGVIGMYRYKLALVPFICILAAYGYDMLKAKRAQGKKTKPMQ